MNKRSIISSLIWKFLQYSSTQGIQFILQIILARLLLPEQFGIIAIVLVFIQFSKVFIQYGFNIALKQKKNVDDLDFTSVLILSLFIALVLYLIIFFSAPFIATFYRASQLILVFRVLSITLFIGAFNSIQLSYIARNFLFKKLFFSSNVAILFSGSIGIFMAYNNYGIWALVTHQLSNIIIVSLVLWFSLKWKPKLRFSYSRINILFKFGWKILISKLIYTIYIDLRTLIIGRIYTPELLGFFNKGSQIPNLMMSNIDVSIQSVMLPTLAIEQDNKHRVKQITRRSISTISLLVFPIMIGLASVGEPLVIILLTEKWLMIVPFLQIFAISSALTPIHTTNSQAINALGRSDVYLKVEILRMVVGLLIILFSIQYGIYALAWSVVLSAALSNFIIAFYIKKLVYYNYIEQIKDIFPALMISIFMGISVHLISYLELNLYIEFIIQILTGVIVYGLLVFIFKLESLKYLIDTIRNFILKEKIKSS